MDHRSGVTEQSPDAPAIRCWNVPGTTSSVPVAQCPASPFSAELRLCDLARVNKPSSTPRNVKPALRSCKRLRIPTSLILERLLQRGISPKRGL
jgi:hypothetical protein